MVLPDVSMRVQSHFSPKTLTSELRTHLKGCPGVGRGRELLLFSLPVPAKNQRFEMSWGNRNDTAADVDVDVASEDVEQGQRVECALSGRIPRGES